MIYLEAVVVSILEISKPTLCMQEILYCEGGCRISKRTQSQQNPPNFILCVYFWNIIFASNLRIEGVDRFATFIQYGLYSGVLGDKILPLPLEQGELVPPRSR